MEIADFDAVDSMRRIWPRPGITGNVARLSDFEFRREPMYEVSVVMMEGRSAVYSF